MALQRPDWQRYFRAQMMTVPNIITLLRILLLPIFVVLFYAPTDLHNVLCASLFALTDWVDGYLARKLGQITRFGAFFDPVADKLLVALALILLVGQYASMWIAIPSAIIICREIFVSALREWMAELGKRTDIAVSNVGKWKTMVQLAAIMCFLLVTPTGFFSWFVYLAYVLLYIAAVLTVWSMLIYWQAAWPELRRGGGF